MYLHSVRAVRTALFSTATTPPQQWRSTTNILPLCSGVNSLSQTQQTHAQAITQGHLPHSISIAAALILSYAKHRSHLSILHSLFSQSVPYSRSPFLHNTIIRASNAETGIGFYNHLLKDSVFFPDEYTFPFVLKLCADFSFRDKGLEVHGRLIKAGLDENVFVNNTLMLFYGSCWDLASAEKVFDEMPERDLVSWNTGIRVFADRGCWVESLSLFKEMIGLSSRLLPNVISFVSVLSACVGFEDERLVRLVHCFVFKVGVDGEVRIGNALVDAYGKCGNMDASKRVFGEMAERNEVSWNSIIGSFAYGGFNRDALSFFRRMIGEGVRLNTVAVATMLPTLVELKLIDRGREIHGFCVKMDMDADLFVGNALIDMYGKLRRFDEASNVFCKMGMRNVVSWNSMIGNFAQNRLESEAIKLVREMEAHGEVPNSITLTNVLPACARIGSLRHGQEIHARSIRLGSAFELFVSNALLDMYAKCGRLDLAEHVFSVSQRDEVSYNILIMGYSQKSECSTSISLFTEMEMLGLKHDSVSYMGVLSACANISAIKEGKQIHGLAVRRLFHEHLFVANSLLDFYTKCGLINIARTVFDRITIRDTASWNTMILGLGMRGELDTAITLFEAMRDDHVEYDAVSYIAVLSACSHGGLVEKGKMYFDDMLARNIKPSEMHYACLVDLLGRCGLMEEAVQLINSLTVKPGLNIWGALLGASRIHCNVELGCWAAEHLIELKPDNSGYYVLLSNMYAEAGRWDDSDRIRKLMSKRGVLKNPGGSWVQGRDRIHGFIAGQSLDPDLWPTNS